MATGLLFAVIPIVQPTSPPKSLDTVRALCHDLPQPLAVIRLLVGDYGGGVRRRLDGTLDQAQWPSDRVEGVIGDAVDDRPACVDVVDLSAPRVLQAQPTTQHEIGFIGVDPVMAVAAPVTITHALVSACGGAFELKPGAAGGVVARIVLPAMSSRAVAS